MKQCRLSTYNQVIEVFEKGFYDDKQFDFLRHEIMDCHENVKPLMWYIDGEWLKQQDYEPPKPKTNTPLTGDQVIDILKFNGYDVWPL